MPGPAQRNYVQPASATDGNGRSTSLPEGARIRLRADRYDELLRMPVCGPGRNRDSQGDIRTDCIPPRTNRRAARAILTALRRLRGDRRRPLADPDAVRQAERQLEPAAARLRRPLPGRQRPHAAAAQRCSARSQATPLLRGNEVQFLRLSDFEVLSLGQVYRFPPLGNTAVAQQTFTPVVP